jgi:hypothetical protein
MGVLRTHFSPHPQRKVGQLRPSVARLLGVRFFE